MDSDNRPLASLLPEVQDGGWARLALDAAHAGWRVRYAEIVVGAMLPGVTRRQWSDGRHAFVEQRVSGRQLAALLTGRRLSLAARTILRTAGPDVARTEWLPSQARYSDVRLPWPATRAQLDWPTDGNRLDHVSGLFVNDSGPSFASHQAALLAFFGRPAASQWQLSSPTVVVYLVDPEARLSGVRIGPTQLTVEIAGDGLRGCQVQVSSAVQDQRRAVTRPGPITFGLSAPLQEETLVLLRGPRVRDFRVIRAPGTFREPDDTISWDDPQVQIETLLFGGENESLEFKARMPVPQDVKSRRTVLKAVPAFANGAGGVLLIGVDDDGTVLGLPDLTDEQVRDRLTSLIRDKVHPVPPFHVECVQTRGQRVAVVSVQAGPDRPYGLAGIPPEFYARHGASTFPASREEIMAWSARPEQVQRGLPW